VVLSNIYLIINYFVETENFFSEMPTVERRNFKRMELKLKFHPTPKAIKMKNIKRHLSSAQPAEQTRTRLAISHEKAALGF